MIRLSPQEIRTMGRQAKGVRLIRLDSNQRLASVVAFEDENNNNQNNDEPSNESEQKEVKSTPAVKADGPEAVMSMFNMSLEDDDQLETLNIDGPSDDDEMLMF